MRISTKTIARAGIIAALYIVLTVAFAPVSFKIVQFRVSEALTLLPILFPESVIGLYLGCIVSNIIGGMGPWDIWLGSFITLTAAIATYILRRSPLAYAPPIVFNGLFVSLYLAPLLNAPYWPTVLSISVSEAVVVLLLGVPLVRALSRIKLFND